MKYYVADSKEELDHLQPYTDPRPIPTTEFELVEDPNEADLAIYVGGYSSDPSYQLESEAESVAKNNHPLAAFRGLSIALNAGLPVPGPIVDYFINATNKLHSVPLTIDADSYPKAVSDALGFQGNAYGSMRRRAGNFTMGLAMKIMVGPTKEKQRGDIKRAKSIAAEDHGVSEEKAKDVWERQASWKVHGGKEFDDLPDEERPKLYIEILLLNPGLDKGKTSSRYITQEKQ